MSRLVILILPSPANLDTIRRCLHRRFVLNPKVEGLGESEELQAVTPGAGSTVFEGVPGEISETLCAEMLRRSLDPDSWLQFFVRYSSVPGGAEALLLAAESLGGWIFDSWARLLPPEEFRQGDSNA